MIFWMEIPIAGLATTTLRASIANALPQANTETDAPKANRVIVMSKARRATAVQMANPEIDTQGASQAPATPS